MHEAVRRGRWVPIGRRVAAVLAAPLAPLFGLLVAYLVYHPPRQRRRYAPSAFGLDPIELWITGSSARGRLHAWRLAGDPQRVVVVGHGMGLDKSHSLAQAQLLHRAGYTVVLFDFRNHGASFRDHALTRFSRRFNDDLVTVVDQVRAMPEYAHARIAVWGFSFSTFPVLDTLARLDGAVHAVICDSGPTRHLSAIIDSLPRSGLLPVPRVLQTAPARTLWQAVYRRLAMAILDPPADWPPAAQQGVSGAPMLFVVGDHDAVTPVAQVRAVARRYPHAEVLVVPGAGHLQAIKVAQGRLHRHGARLPRAIAEHASGRGVAAQDRDGGSMNKLRPGAVISARELITIRSMRIRLPDPTGVVHLQFRRYAGCPFCDLHLRSIVQRHQELVAAGIREVVVSSPRRRSSSPNRVTCRSPSSPTPQTVAGAALGGLVATTVFLVPR